MALEYAYALCRNHERQVDRYAPRGKPAPGLYRCSPEKGRHSSQADEISRLIDCSYTPPYSFDSPGDEEHHTLPAADGGSALGLERMVGQY